MKKLLVEFIGTFFLVFTVGATLIPPGVGLFAPLAIGASLMVMIYAGSHVSGAHFNPAVTFAAWLRGRIPARDVIPYWVAQVAAALAAAWLMTFFKLEGSAQELPIGIKAAFVAEFIFTFALAWVFLNTTAPRQAGGNSFYGLAIGMTFMVGGFAVGNISGGAFDPAIAAGFTLMGLLSRGHFEIFLLAEFGGAAVAALAYMLVNGKD